MPDNQEGEDFPSEARNLENLLGFFRDEVFADLSLPDELSEKTGYPVSELKLVDREVEALPWKCDHFHEHLTISLIETFQRQAEGVEPMLSLEAALDKFRAEASVEPAGVLGMSDETGADGRYLISKDRNTVLRVGRLRMAFHTEASLKPRPRTSSLSSALLSLLLENLDFGDDSKGPGNKDDGPKDDRGPRPK